MSSVPTGSLRTPEQQKKYRDFLDTKHDGKCIFCEKKRLIKEFTHWAVIVNDFWYDTVSAEGSAMVFPKRHICGESYLNDVESKEWIEVVKPWFHQNYNWLFENSQKERSISAHYHKHLLLKK